MAARSCSLALVALLAATPSTWAAPTGDVHDGAQAAPQAAPAPQPAVQARPGWTDNENPSTDQTVDVAKGTRLVLNAQAGEVIVRAWDRDQVRVQAKHSSRDRVDVQTADNTLRVRTRSARGQSGPVDYTLTVPRWMAVNLSGTYLAATVEGTSAEVTVETVGGDLTLKGGSGTVSLRSVEGEIRVEGASGKVTASTVNDSITVTGVTGDVIAETVNGDVVITNTKASSLEVSTVNGDVRFEGPTADKGVYRVTTHQGDIRVSLGAQANATVFVRTFRGDFSSDFPVTLPRDDSGRDGNKRFNFTLGAGSARVELQSFQGDIHVAKGALRPRERGRNNRGRNQENAGLGGLGRGFEARLEQFVEAQAETVGAAVESQVESLVERLERQFEVVTEHADDADHDDDWAIAPEPPSPPAPPAPPLPPAPPAPPRAPKPPRP